MNDSINARLELRRQSLPITEGESCYEVAFGTMRRIPTAFTGVRPETLRPLRAIHPPCGSPAECRRHARAQCCAQ